MVLIRSPERVSSEKAGGPPKLFPLPPHVVGGPSVCRRALSLVTKSETAARSLLMQDRVCLVQKDDKTWIIVLDLPKSEWLPAPTTLRTELGSKGLAAAVGQ